MKMIRLAFINFRNSFKSYLSLVLSLSFTIMILYNFQNIIYSDIFAVLGQHNKEYIDIIVQVVTIVLLCFMFFFIWYAMNVFLTKRKREIGIYIFMGMSNGKIGGLYVIETGFVGITAFIAGIVSGALFTGLFQLVMVNIAGIMVDAKFGISPEAIAFTAGSFLVMYMIFALKGYINIVRSSVLDMISAAKQNEYVHMKSGALFTKAALGIIVLASGFYTANAGGRYRMMENALLAVVLVIIGVYLLFGGLIPLVFQILSKNKVFLYGKQRCLWINQTIFRMKKNYRTYAMVCIIGICSATALATGFAMKGRYRNMILFDNQYTFQLLTNVQGLDEKAANLIKNETDITYQTSITALAPDNGHMVLAYSDVERIAKERGIEFTLPEPADDETFFLSHQIVLSFFTDERPEPVTIADEVYNKTKIIREPYIGYMQREIDCFYIVSDNAYERLKPLSTVMYIHNYKIADDTAFTKARAAVNALTCNTEENFTARVAVDPYDNELDWLKILYPLCVFMFLVFIIAGGCIMFMKLYNDSFEEKERYLVLKKLGLSTQTLSASISHELFSAYVLPFAVMAVSAYFSVHALGKMMFTNLFSVYVASALSVMAVFALYYIFSVVVYRRNVGV